MLPIKKMAYFRKQTFLRLFTLFSTLSIVGYFKNRWIPKMMTTTDDKYNNSPIIKAPNNGNFPFPFATLTHPTFL